MQESGCSFVDRKFLLFFLHIYPKRPKRIDLLTDYFLFYFHYCCYHRHGMAKSVEEAMMRVQVKTILRGVYLGTSEDDAIQRELGLVSGREVEVLRSRGSNIHFVFRKENFG